MGTTLDAIKNQPGVQLGISVQIEGWDYLLCDADSATSAASCLAAFSGCDSSLEYTGAVRGLQIDWGDQRQEIDPWSAEFRPTNLRILVDDGLDDTIGAAVMRTGAGSEYAINADVDPTDSSITIVNGGALSGTSAGTKFWLGAECMTYSSSGATSFTPAIRGAFAPFKANTETSQRFAHSHRMPSAGFGVQFQTKLTSQPRRWIGRYVAVRLHRIVGGTWDDWDEAHLAFAGTIQDIQDTANARTVLSCEDIRGKLNNTVLYRDQWRGRIKPGLYVQVGTVWHLTEWNGSTRKSTADASESLTWVASSPTTYQAVAGVYDADTLVLVLNAWMLKLSSYTGQAWEWSRGADGRIVGTVQGSTAGHEYYLEVENMAYGGEELLPFLGFDSYQRLSTGGRILAQKGEGDDEAAIVADGLPYVSVAFQNGNTIELDAADGNWASMGDLAPEPFKSRYSMTTAGKHGFIRIGDHVFVADYTSDSFLAEVFHDGELTALLGGTSAVADATEGGSVGSLVGTREGEAEKFVEQIIFMESDFQTMMASLFCSVEGDAYNHATYDNLGAGLGAGIPWELLGTAFLNSLDTVNSQTGGGNLTVLIEKPTKLSEIIGADLLLRRATLIFADGGYKFVIGSSPNASQSQTSLSESTKGGPRMDSSDHQRTTTEHTARYLRNQLKIEYNRGVDGKYTDSLNIINQASINEFGESRPVTIRARNTWGGEQAVIDNIGALGAGVASYLLSTFGFPVKLYRRTINHNYAHLVPGDPVTVTDDYARDPETGTRGITSKPGIIFASQFDWGGDGQDPTGEIVVLFEDFDRAGAYCPCMDIDDTESSGTYSAGYDSSNLYLKVYANRWSDASESDDITHFDVGDVIRIVEIDPANGSAPDEWTRTISAKSEAGQYITISSALSSPAWDSAKKYRIISANYGSAQASQQTHIYQADLDDWRVVDTVDPFEFGQNANNLVVSPEWDVATERPERMPTAAWSGDGVAMTPAHIVNAGRFATNGNAYRSAPQFGMLQSSYWSAGNGTDYYVAAIIPISVGANYYQDRYLYWGPIMRSSSGGTTVQAYTYMLPFSKIPALAAAIDADGRIPAWPADLYTAGAMLVAGTTTDQATWQHKTAQKANDPISSVVLSDIGEMFILLVLQGDTGVYCQVKGFHTFYLGPPE